MTEAQKLVAIDADIVTIALSFSALAFALVIAMWGIARSAASKQDVAVLTTRIETVDVKATETAKRLAEVERAISHLPTSDHVHNLDIRLERVATTVEASARQIDRVLDHLMSTSAPPPSDTTGAAA